MPRRVAIALLTAPQWSPPGVDPLTWWLALAEDICDVLARLAEVDPAVAFTPSSADVAAQVGWPGLRRYAVDSPDLGAVLAAASADGYEQAVVLAADAPDLPGMLIAKLLRPLTSHPLSAAPAIGEPPGLLGLGAALPAPAWMPALTLDGHTPQTLRRHAPRANDVAPAPGWHRLRTAADLGRLDPRLEGWDATRALLGP